jgi:hypothetical protein
MSSKRDIHVVPNGNQWNVVREGGSTPLSTHRTQGAAEDAGRTVARRDSVELVTHRPDGTIRDRDSFGNDPHPPIDRKH